MKNLKTMKSLLSRKLFFAITALILAAIGIAFILGSSNKAYAYEHPYPVHPDFNSFTGVHKPAYCSGSFKSDGVVIKDSEVSGHLSDRKRESFILKDEDGDDKFYSKYRNDGSTVYSIDMDVGDQLKSKGRIVLHVDPAYHCDFDNTNPGIVFGGDVLNLTVHLEVCGYDTGELAISVPVSNYKHRNHGMYYDSFEILLGDDGSNEIEYTPFSGLVGTDSPSNAYTIKQGRDVFNPEERRDRDYKFTVTSCWGEYGVL